jgi:hypothetical protein
VFLRGAPYSILALAIAVVHGREVTFGFTSLDDVTLIANDQAFLASSNAIGRAFGRVYFHAVDPAHAYYRPIVTATYALDTRAFGGAVAAYHATNVLFHVVATCLVHALLARAGFGRRVALLASLLFAVHPALVSTIADRMSIRICSMRWSRSSFFPRPRLNAHSP